MLCIHSSTLETQYKQGMTAPKDHLHGSQLVIRCLRTFHSPPSLPFLSFFLLVQSCPLDHVLSSCAPGIGAPRTFVQSAFLLFCGLPPRSSFATRVSALLSFLLVGGCFLPCPSLIGWRYTANPFRVSRVLVLGVQSSPAGFHPTTNQDTSSGFTST